MNPLCFSFLMREKGSGVTSGLFSPVHSRYRNESETVLLADPAVTATLSSFPKETRKVRKKVGEGHQLQALASASPLQFRRKNVHASPSQFLSAQVSPELQRRPRPLGQAAPKQRTTVTSFTQHFSSTAPSLSSFPLSP